MFCYSHIPSLLLYNIHPLLTFQAAIFCAMSVSCFSPSLQQKVDGSQEVGLHWVEVFSC